jgi:hypothetical protein
VVSLRGVLPVRRRAANPLLTVMEFNGDET